MGICSLDWIYLADALVEWRPVLNKVMNLRIPERVGIVDCLSNYKLLNKEFAAWSQKLYSKPFPCRDGPTRSQCSRQWVLLPSNVF
jgi:hypothetical protein